jgi:hypothetical protein
VVNENKINLTSREKGNLTMSEVRLNLIDSQTIVHSTIHGSVADAVIAALSAEPETIKELEAAMERYDKCPPDFSSWPHFKIPSMISALDTRPYDAGIVIVDLAARVIAIESTYSQPEAQGHVNYHDGKQATDIPVMYRLPDDWLILRSVYEYEMVRGERFAARASNPPFDARAILYGRPLLEFIALNVQQSPEITQTSGCREFTQGGLGTSTTPGSEQLRRDAPAAHNHSAGDGCACTMLTTGDVDVDKREFVGQSEERPENDSNNPLAQAISDIHARWLLTPREDLRGLAPRDVMLAKQDFIDFDLHTRSLQWGLQLEGPPCLSTDSFAYRFAGFGSHEWILYYDLVRELLWSAAADVRQTVDCRDVSPNGTLLHTSNRNDECNNSKFAHRKAEFSTNQSGPESVITRLEQLKTGWLEQPLRDLEGGIPGLIIDNERRRLPEAMGGRTMVIDEDCPVCKMMGDEAESGLEIYFWHLDGCNMDDGFAFSSFRTLDEWEIEQRRRQEFDREFDRKCKERRERLARGETLEPDPFFDPVGLDELFTLHEEVIDQEH